MSNPFRMSIKFHIFFRIYENKIQFYYKVFIKMVTFAPDEVGLADKSPCAGIRADLKMCLLESNCCKREKKTPRDCLKDGSVPDECLQLRQIFFECKRSLLDNRRRFRGHKGY